MMVLSIEDRVNRREANKENLRAKDYVWVRPYGAPKDVVQLRNFTEYASELGFPGAPSPDVGYKIDENLEDAVLVGNFPLAVGPNGEIARVKIDKDKKFSYLRDNLGDEKPNSFPDDIAA